MYFTNNTNKHCHRYISTLRYLAIATLPFFTLPATATITDSAEIAYLTQFYNSTNGGSWNNNSGWLTGDPCDNNWVGITCNGAETTVIDIDLAMNNLSGPIPSNLADLQNLEGFQASQNALTGQIPAIDQLASLEFFSVTGNQLTGTIPDLSGLNNLSYLSISDNQLTGPITNISGLPALTYFVANNNQLSGSIPELSQIPTLEAFIIDNNQISGEIPSLDGLSELGYFAAINNQLTGEIPNLDDLIELAFFEVSGNQLSGEIPSLANLTSLANFVINDNQFTGPLPNPPASLQSGMSNLCPNYLERTDNSDWDTATGETPWHSRCVDAPRPDLKVQNVPSLSGWMMLLGIGLLALFAVTALKRR